MRDIVFRGKRVDNGEWVQGSLLSLDDGGHRIVTSGLIDFDSAASADMICSYAVEEDSVGQYTGIKDKNGKPIFEGDVVHCTAIYDEENMEIAFECGEFCAIFKGSRKGRVTDCNIYSTLSFAREIIGNIHDNPELLEAEP